MAKDGCKPKKLETTKFDASAPANAFNQTRGEKLWKTSSSTKSAPLSGAPKAADRPLAAPVASKTRELVFVCLNPSPTPCPIEEPSCKEGPSGPKKSPVPITKIPPINLRHRIGNHFTDSFPCNSSFTSGIPDPPTCGYCLTKYPAITATMINPITIATNQTAF